MTSTLRSADMASKVGVSANYKAVFLYAFRQGYENEITKLPLMSNIWCYVWLVTTILTSFRIYRLK